jgi:hypothetical protein
MGGVDGEGRGILNGKMETTDHGFDGLLESYED